MHLPLVTNTRKCQAFRVLKVRGISNHHLFNFYHLEPQIKTANKEVSNQFMIIVRLEIKAV